MTILDKSKIRPDVLKVWEDTHPVRLQANEEFFKIKENQTVDFPALWKKLMVGNVRALKGEDMHGYLDKEEQLFLAKYHRFIVEYLANYEQKNVSPIPKNVICEQVDAGGVSAEWQTVSDTKENRILLYFHGGGYIMGSPNFRRLLTVKLGKATKMRVLSVDYRLAPEHPYPAGLQDCTSVYHWLLSQGFKSPNIIIAGDSAGGYFTLMTLVDVRNKGLSLPAGAVCLSPATDLALTSDSYTNNAATDPVLADLGIFWWAEAYLAGTDPHVVSPLYADLTDLPPLLIQVSTSEMLFNDSTRLVEHAKAAGVDVILQTWEDTLHVFQAFELPESKEAIAKISEFVQKQVD
ncbi:MAG: alpha/beta hydrolase [Candidatus Hermodarchaeota archaeon]